MVVCFSFVAFCGGSQQIRWPNKLFMRRYTIYLYAWVFSWTDCLVTSVYRFFNRLAFLKPFIHLNMWRAFKVSLSSRQNGTCSSTDQPARRSCVCGRRSRHFSSNLKKRNPKRLRTNKYFLNYGETYFFAGIGFSGPPKQQITAASARCVPDGCISFCLLCLPVFLKTFGAPE